MELISLQDTFKSEKTSMALTATRVRSFWAQNTTVGARLAACWGARAGRDGGRVVERSPGGTAPRGGTGDVDSVQAEERHTRLDHADRREDFAGRPVTVTDDFHRRAGVCKPALPAAARPRTWLAGGHGSGNGLAAKVEDLAEQVGLGRTPAPPGTGDGGTPSVELGAAGASPPMVEKRKRAPSEPTGSVDIEASLIVKSALRWADVPPSPGANGLSRRS